MWSFFLGVSCFAFLIGSVMVGASASSMWAVWAAMEINMLVFVAALVLAKTVEEPQAMKYFLVQSIGSAMLLLWVLTLSHLSPSFMMSMAYFSMVLKLGLAPLHWWFTDLASKVEWVNFFVVCTAQKLLPLMVISLLHVHVLCVWLSVTSAAVGALGSMGQLEVKKLLAYSSVFNGAWMIGVSESASVLLTFVGLYSMSLLVVVIVLKFNQLALSAGLWHQGSMGIYTLVAALLSLGGVPPMVGFYAKIVAVAYMVESFDVVLASALTVSAVFLVYVYTRLSYTGLCSMTLGALWGRRQASQLTVALLLIPTLVAMAVLCEGVCTGNFGFPGLI